MQAWARELIVDPLSKEPLQQTETKLVSPYGRCYPITDGVFDLRLLQHRTTNDEKTWAYGQQHYERWYEELVRRDVELEYFAEIDQVRDVYDAIPVTGRCLDIGGSHGRLRAFLAADQEYVSCDPFMSAVKNLHRQPNLLAAYPFLKGPINFVCCEAEFLPFRSCSFDTAHMRSVIDHFLNPELALSEAYRVLRQGGSLVVGLYVDGGRGGKRGVLERARELARETLGACGIERYVDAHVWHPTFDDLCRLIESCGFAIGNVHWQKSNGRVCYLRCDKRDGHMRNALLPKDSSLGTEAQYGRAA